MTAPAQQHARVGARAWIGLAVLMLPVLLVAIDNTVLSFALPAIALDLQPAAAVQLWIVDSYPLVLAGLLVAMGNLADRLGRRRVLLVGATGFAAVSVLAAFATTAELLLGARILLGLFGAALMPSTLSLIRGMFQDARQRRLAIAVWATGFALGSAIGPIVGGLLLAVAPWGAVFLIAVPVLLPLLVLAPIFVTESRDPAPGPFDVASIVLSMLTMAPIVFAIKHVATEGLDLQALAGVTLGLAAGALFVRRLLRQPNPLLDVRLFAVPAFTGSVLVNLMSVVSLVGLLYFLSQHLQLVAGLSALGASLVLLPGAALMVAASMLTVRLSRTIRPSILMAVGLLLSSASYVAIAIAGPDATVLLFGATFAAVSMGVGAAETLSNDLIVASVPPAKAGAASAVSETAYELGAVLGTAVLGGILTASYRQNLVVPQGVDGAAARETLAGALDTAASLPAGLGEQLAASARHAFDTGVVTTSIVAAVLTALAAALTLVLVRRAR